MKICGIQKLTLLDYPNHTACTLFTPGCTFRCPFCHNAGLVLRGGEAEYPLEDIIEFLKSRKGRLDGVCITGGEPLLQMGIEDFINQIQAEGFKVKLDTNGIMHEKLKKIVNGGLVDYVAMDIKNCFEKYAVSAGTDVNAENVKKSVEFLKTCRVDYEFRTTVVKELNSPEDMQKLARDIGDVRAYYLQQYKDSGDVVGTYGGKTFTAYSPAEMKELCELVKANGGKNACVRGVD